MPKEKRFPNHGTDGTDARFLMSSTNPFRRNDGDGVVLASERAENNHFLEDNVQKTKVKAKG
jgi:hypothetical protein